MTKYTIALALFCCGPTAVASPTTTPKIVAAADAFLATLSAAQRETVLFERGDTAQKQNWSNLPGGIFERAGLTWGEMNEAQRNAWLAVMQITLSEEGYRRVLEQWRADDALPPPAARAQGRGPLFGMQYYYIALIGMPSTTEPWQWQWGGHHVTVNATIVGPNLTLTPTFVGVEPGTYTDSAGNTVRPLGDIEKDAFALVNWLDEQHKPVAILGDAPINVLLGPGQDGKAIPSEGLSAARMSVDQRDALLRLIDRYTGLANDEDAALRTAEVRSALEQTYFAWYGPTTPGSGVYFRVTSPTLVIEYAAQGGGPGGGARTPNHVHGIYREPGNDYGAKYLSR